MMFVASCTRLQLDGMSEPVADAHVERLYVATMRSESQARQIFGEKRSEVMNYGTMDISIPPNHVPGQLERTRGLADANQFFAPVGYEVMPDVSTFSKALRRENHTGDTVFVYVHGYNATLEDAAFRLAQIKHDFGIEQPAILFSWPSAGRLAGYVYDRDSVLFARDDLEDLIRDLRARGHRRIFIMAHSMGSYLTMEALRQISLKGDRYLFDAIDGVALMSPDIDPDVFRRQAEEIGQLPQPFLIMTAQQDKALSISSFLTGRKPRLGRISSAKDVQGLGITVWDFSNFATGGNLDHFVPVTSPAAISLLRTLSAQAEKQRSAFSRYVLWGKDGASMIGGPGSAARQ